MTTFDKREASFEAAFAHDEELRFRALAPRRDRWLGLWAADKLGMTETEAADYARTLVAAEIAHGDDHLVVAKLAADFAAADTPVSESEIRLKMIELLAKAITDLRAGR